MKHTHAKILVSTRMSSVMRYTDGDVVNHKCNLHVGLIIGHVTLLDC
jgi:hypothetical protein